MSVSSFDTAARDVGTVDDAIDKDRDEQASKQLENTLVNDDTQSPTFNKAERSDDMMAFQAAATASHRMSISAQNNNSSPAPPHNEADENDTRYPEPAQEELLPPPDFKPFFTLIEDPATGEFRHPTVHYVFADDDPDLLTSASLDALERSNTSATDDGYDRFVILDMSSDAKEIISATSLSPHWQALQTRISPAPSWVEDSAAENRGLMVRISGQEVGARNALKQRRASLKGSGGFDAALKTFDERLSGLDEVLGFGATPAAEECPKSGQQ